jgi:hypothetical protein
MDEILTEGAGEPVVVEAPSPTPEVPTEPVAPEVPAEPTA